MNHILYNPSLLKKSYETTQVIQDKINAVIREVLPVSDDFCFVQLNPEETFQNDGSLFNQKLELKQRQSFYISEVYNKERQPYVDTTIQRSSTMHQSDEYYGAFCSSRPELEQHHSGQKAAALEACDILAISSRLLAPSITARP